MAPSMIVVSTHESFSLLSCDLASLIETSVILADVFEHLIFMAALSWVPLWPLIFR